MRIAIISGLTHPQVSSDLGAGLSTLNKWVQKHQHNDLISGPHEDVKKETERLSNKIRLLRKYMEVLKRGNNLLCGPKLMRVAFINA